jgi:hypothetical protein
VRRLLLPVAALVLIVPLVIASAPQLLYTTPLGWSLRGKSWDQRRQIVFGGYYTDVMAIRRSIPANETIALIPKHPDDRDVAMFSVYHFYPHPARVYLTVDEWQRAPDRPRRIVWVDHGKLAVAKP